MSSQSLEQRFHSTAVRKLSLPLSLLSRAEKNTHSCLLISSLVSLPSSLLLRPPSSVMNGRYEFSAASLGFSLRPSAAVQTTRSQLKGAIRNLFELRTFGVYLCMALKEEHGKWILWSCHNSKAPTLFFFSFFFNSNSATVNKLFMSSY